MNYYKRHLGDFGKSLGNLSQGQVGAYDLLLDWHYANECPLPLEPDELYRIGRCQTKAERDNVDRVLRYFDKTPEGYLQKRAMEEMEKATEKANRNREIGRRGGRPRNPDGSILETQTVSKKNPSHYSTTPIAKEQKQKQALTGALPPPEDVDSQTWADWLALRKAKRAPVTETVLREARGEAAKAGMPFAQFLAVWCRRGSQGLEADWLKPNERAGPARAKPSAAANFRGTDYGTTDIDSLPADMRDAVKRELGNG